MSPGRVASFCVAFFLVSALIFLSLQSRRPRATWPRLFSHDKAHPIDEIYVDVAFATFLSGEANKTNTSSPDREHSLQDIDFGSEDPFDITAINEDNDGYFLGARVLGYNLLHNPYTRTNNSIPFIVLVTEDVSPSKRARLTADGATVILTEKLNADWIHPHAVRWRDVLTKLRLFQLTRYRKICFIDADMLVTAPLDGVFDDPATDLKRTKDESYAVKSDEAVLPPTYMFAGKAEAFGYKHDIPPKPSDYLNSGFFVFRPSQELFAYYMSLIGLSDRFDSGFPEQNLLNYAHRRDGNMPWQTLSWRWNMNWPTVRDFDLGAKSFHAKYWDGDPTHDPVLRRKWEKQRDEMRGYYRGVYDGHQQTS